MNSQGYTKDNIHKGNTKIVAGGIDVDGLIRIGDQSAGGDGYVLPAVKGTEGQVLTMNADNTSSFQDGGGTSGRVIKNLFTMIDRNTTFSITPENVYLTGYGSLDLGSIDNFPVGATIHLYTKGIWQTNGGGVLGSFALIINDGDPTTITLSAPVLSMTNNNQRMFYNDLILQRTGTNEYKFKGTGMTSSGGSGTPAECIFWSTTTITPTTPFTTFDLRFAWVTNANTFYPLTTTLIVDMILDSSLLITTPPAPTSHTSLTDLTAGDSGHTQFAQLNGRSGGQILSGGVLPIHNLTLKSHDIGLPNVIVRDLNTTFEKNIDMNQNQIDNVLVVNNQTGPLNLIGGSGVSAVLIDATPTQGIIIGCNVGASTEITGDTELSLISNTGNIEVNPFTQMNVNVGGLPRLSVDASEVSSGNNLNMNNNNINNVNNVVSSGTLNLESSGGGGQRIELDGTFITFFNNTITPSITPSGIDVNNGVISNVSAINNLTPVGGLFAGISDSLNVSATTAEISILPLAFVGVGFGVPPNGFSVGDTFRLELSGPFNSNNNDTLTIRLKGGPTSTTLLTTLVVPLNASTGSVFQLSTLFQIRAIGGAGVADIVSDADLTYNQSGAGGSFVGEQSLSQNNTTFDTTVANVLDVTAQFSSTSVNNNMTTRVSKLNKVF